MAGPVPERLRAPPLSTHCGVRIGGRSSSTSFCDARGASTPPRCRTSTPSSGVTLLCCYLTAPSPRGRLAGRTLPRTQEEMEWMLRQRPTSRAFRMLRSESMRMQGRMRASKVARPRGFAAERGLRLVN